ncbi:MAG: hypothetical protein KIT38_13265 [Gemmatimonadaceae bacterium]|nr:hypothetical protein [Gemmatimonadaceae bacterium]
MECCHQHERIAALIKLGADDQEFAAAWDMADLAEKQMSLRTASYEEVAAAGRGGEAEDWWHRANALWMACREYSRRYSASSDAASRRKRHTEKELQEIAVEYELEVSARMAVKQAIREFAAARQN